MKLYIISEAQQLEGACDGAESLASYAKAFASLAEAEEALRGDEFMREVVTTEYDGAPEVDYDEIIDEILKTKQTVDGVDYYYWEATDRIATWRVQAFEFSL